MATKTNGIPDDRMDLKKRLLGDGLLAGDLDGEQPHQVLHRPDDKLRQRVVQLPLPVRVVLDHLRRLAANLMCAGTGRPSSAPGLAGPHPRRD